MNYSKDKIKFHKVYNFPGTHTGIVKEEYFAVKPNTLGQCVTSFITGKPLPKVKSFDARCVFSNN